MCLNALYNNLISFKKFSILKFSKEYQPLAPDKLRNLFKVNLFIRSSDSTVSQVIAQAVG
jgi:hypothetical protein